MLLSLTLVAPDLDILEEVLPDALEAVAGAGYPVKDMQILGPGALDLLVEGDDPVILRARAEQAMLHRPVDICAQLADGRRKRLLIADMDSTIIGCECLDELADFAGLRDPISAITERAMRG
jgi:phosphoserine phosphatase